MHKKDFSGFDIIVTDLHNAETEILPHISDTTFADYNESELTKPIKPIQKNIGPISIFDEKDFSGFGYKD